MKTPSVIVVLVVALSAAIVVSACAPAEENSAPPRQMSVTIHSHIWRRDRGEAEPPVTRFCFPSAYNDAQAMRAPVPFMTFLFHLSSLEPAALNDHGADVARIHVEPGDAPGTMRFDSLILNPTGRTAPASGYEPAATAYELNPLAHSPLPPPQFTNFTSDSYEIVPDDETWKGKYQATCAHTGTYEGCSLAFQSGAGFVVKLSTAEPNIRNMPALMASVDRLLARFQANCTKAATQ